MRTTSALLACLAVVSTTALAACSSPAPAPQPTADPGQSALSAPPIVFADGTTAGVGKPLSEAQLGQDIESVRMDVLIDGWSYKALGGNVVWDAGPNDGVPLEFTPVTPADIQELLSTTPEVVEDVLARTVTPASDVSCSSQGCTSSHPIDLSWLTNPASVPTFGPVYQGYGVESLLYVASVTVDNPFPFATLRGPEDLDTGDGVLLPTLPTQLVPAEQPQQGNGFWRNRVLLAGSFGKVWHANPQWVVDGADFAPNYSLDDSSATTAAVQAFPAPVTRFKGLADPWPGSDGLNSSQLTYYSSPTSGCGPVALCAPTSVQWKFTSVDTAEEVCSAGMPTVTVSTSRASLSVDLPAPTSQFGAWGGLTPEEFSDVPPAGGVNGGGFPPLLEAGQQELFTTTLYLWQGGESPRVTAAAGQVTEYAEGQKDVDTLLSEGYVLGKPYTPCS